MDSNNRSNIVGMTIVYGLVLFLVLPIIFMGFWSVTREWGWPHLLPESFTLEAWRDFLFADARAWEALGESFLVGLGVVVLALGISIPAGKALALYQFPGKELINVLVLAPIIVPPLAVTMGIHINFLRLGLSGSIWGVILVHLIPSIPYSIKILTHTFEASGKKLEEQAQVLGANARQRFLHITWPLIKPGVISAGIMVFIVSFSQYILTFLMGEGRVITFPVVLFPLVERGSRTLASVYSFVFVAAVLVFIFILEWVLKEEGETSGNFHL